MKKAIFYREWIKCRRVLFVLAAVYIGVLGYLFIDINQIFSNSPAVRIWNILLNNETNLVSNFKWLSLLAGVALAVSQFVPEMVSKRYKLTLHLPMKENTILFTLLGFGLMVITILSLVALIAITICMSSVLASEFVVMALMTVAPWILGGYCAYLLVSSIIIEPSWKRKIVLAIVTYFVVSLFYENQVLGAFAPALIPFAIAIIAMIVLPFSSTIRFKDSDEK
ncbi:MAG: hypothetical protein R3Y22_09400 [Bacteroidales bacterium]